MAKAVAAIKAGAWDYLHRPISSDELSEKIAQAQMTAEEWVQRNADPVVVYIGRHATAISCRAEVANRFGLSLDTVSSRFRASTKSPAKNNKIAQSDTVSVLRHRIPLV